MHVCGLKSFMTDGREVAKILGFHGEWLAKHEYIEDNNFATKVLDNACKNEKCLDLQCLVVVSPFHGSLGYSNNGDCRDV